MSKERYAVVGAHTIKDVINYEYLQIKDGCKLLNQQDQRIKELEEQLAITEKALEMACEYLNDYQYFDSDCPRYSYCDDIENSKFWDCENCDCSKLAMDYFKTKAKENKSE